MSTVCECDGKGWASSSYYESEWPDGWTPIQTCDLCDVYPGDDDAAEALALCLGVAWACALDFRHPALGELEDEFEPLALGTLGHGEYVVEHPCPWDVAA